MRINADNAPAANLHTADLGQGSYLLHFDGIPGKTYRIEFTTDANQQNWQPLGSGIADPFGSLTFNDTPPTGSLPRSYRLVYP